MSATSWSSELPSGRNPCWIKDEALAGLGLLAGDAVSVDTRPEPEDGDLALVEIETDELADRLVRRYFVEADERVRLASASPGVPDLLVSVDQMIALGVVRGRVRFEETAGDGVRVIEEPLPPLA